MAVVMNKEKLLQLQQDASNVCKLIDKLEQEVEVKQNKISNLLPKGYWWTYSIDREPKKYRIQKTTCESNKTYITVKEVNKKYYGEHVYNLNEFLELHICKSEKEIREDYYNRICPKCGGLMKLSKLSWCSDCMQRRQKLKHEFMSNHKFYDPKDRSYYTIGYTDELTRNCDKGFHGQHFIIRRLDTNEIIHTDNLWVSYGEDGNIYNSPEIEFLDN